MQNLWGSRLLARAGVVGLAVALLVAVATPADAAKPGPDTVIDTRPSSATPSADASFTFHSTASGATFACRLDAGASEPCTSPKAYPGLSAGAHTFSVTSTANGSTDPSPATYSWTIDPTSPTAPTGLRATTPTMTSVVLSWTAGTDNVAVTGNDVYRDGSKLVSVGAVTSYTDATVTAGSTHTYAVRATDAAGNASPLSADVTATTPTSAPVPDTVIDSGPAPPPSATKSTSATFTFHATLPGASFSCRLDGGSAVSCTSPFTRSGLAEGTHTFAVTATLNGATDPTPATAGWVVDLTAPSVPTGLTTAATASAVDLTWSPSTDSVGVAGYDVFRGGALLASVGAVTSYADPAVTAGATYSYAVRAKDAAGNLSALGTTSSATVMSALDPHLSRAPYLTDLVGQGATVNFATDRSTTVASVRYGAVGAGGACTPSTTVAATKIVVAVGAVFEYQWKARLDLPQSGSYCYRPFLGSTDLLGTNASPQFTTQVPPGSAQPYSFAVFGDWGQAYASGGNTDQANVMAQLANSGVRFAITTGDNGYPAGSQLNYGDLQQSGADVSGIFGPQQWGVPGATIPVFPAIGNHGLARSDAIHPHFGIWPQDVAVATSSGSYTTAAYPSVNGSEPATYPSPWYAFDAGEARYYVLDAAWADLNAGTASDYVNEAASHWSATSPEYLWLKKDLAAHPSGLKFAFFHYPLYSDQPGESSDTSLQGSSSLEGLLTANGVNLAFQGHAHIYQRSSGLGGLVSYVTGGGGAQAQSTGACSRNDRYAIGWSYTNNRGTACGSAAAPTSDAQVYHFLKVTVNGSQVTVTPTDSTGRTFDVQTYTFKPQPDTFIDSTPPVGAPSTSATFTFHASDASATFTCKLDGGASTACSSPVTYTGLAQGPHTFSTVATVKRTLDPLPATYSWTVDTAAPTTPGDVTATAESPFQVGLSWAASTDNTGVTGYDLWRDGKLFESLGAVTSYTDTAVLASSHHQYAVRARDVAGNVSSLTVNADVTTPPPPAPVFADGFESGTLSLWKPTAGLAVQGATVHGGTHAAEGNTQNGGTYAKVTLPGSFGDAWARAWFDVVAQPDQVNLLRLRDSAGSSLGYVYVGTSGQLGFHDDATGTNTVSDTIPSPGWHALELHLQAGSAPGALGVVQIWLDNVMVTDLSSTAVDVGSAPVGIMQIGDAQTGLAYDVAFDDVAFGTSRLGPDADSAPPSTPADVAATAQSAFSVQVSWSASSDNVGVSSYDVLRDGVLVGNVPASATTFTDATVLAATTYLYTVQARDDTGNVSEVSPSASATTPAAAAPVFSDGFETGDLTRWTTSGGLTVSSASVRSGGYAARGSSATGVTWAKKTLTTVPGEAYPDAYARVGFLVGGPTGQVTLLRLRDTASGVGGFVYLSSTGRLAFRSDALAAGTVSAVTPGPGWHVVELHMRVNSAPTFLGTVEVWLDGALVPGLSSAAIDVGAAPIGVLQVGDTSSSSTGWDVVFDDAAFGTGRLGPTGDVSAPTVPGNVNAAASSSFSVHLSWDPSTDDTDVTGYDVFRDGVLLHSVGTVTSYDDNSVLNESTHTYAVRARDLAANLSALSGPVTVTTPATGLPVFADGFESGTVGAWTATGGLVVSNDARSGAFAAEGVTTDGGVFAKMALPSGYADAYGRVGVKMKTLPSGTISLLRLRDAGTSSVGNVFLTSGGKLGFSGGTVTPATTTNVSLGTGWHSIELHVGVSGASSSYQVWLDGAPVAGLSGGLDLTGSGSVSILQVGDSALGRTYDVVYDDAAFSDSRVGV
ncbi:MAG: metallophosphoesterase [Actinomycetes bacterium]